MNISELLGKTINKIDINSEETRMTFYCNDKTYLMYHSQDCCENVSIDDIEGNLEDLISSPVLQAEEVVSENDKSLFPPKWEEEESYTWTFYKLATIKGYVTIKWYGSSNGYYSESVDFVDYDEPRYD